MILQKFTKEERSEHIERWRKFSEMTAYRVAKNLPLDETQQSFLRMVLREGGNQHDHASALREWAQSYAPGKSAAGTYPKIRNVDTAYAYVMHRAEGNAHTTTLLELVKTYATGNANTTDPADRFERTKVSKQGLWKAIEPLLPRVCEDLGIDPATIAERKPRGRPPKQK